jgi:nucleotide-binding universal stress UspA family protein
VAAGNEQTGKRVLVAVNASPRSAALLEIAADLAEQIGAQIETLFVEDVNLVQLANLPLAAELDRTSGNVRMFDLPDITSAMRAQAQRLGKTLQGIGERKNIRTRMRVVRGHYVPEAMQVKADVSILLTSKRVSSVMQKFIPDTDGRMHRIRSFSDVYVYCTSQSELQRVFSLASDLASVLGTGLSILMPIQNNKKKSEFMDRIQRQITNIAPVRFEDVQPDISEQIRLISAGGHSILVMSKSEVMSQIFSDSSLESIQCPLVLVE